MTSTLVNMVLSFTHPRADIDSLLFRCLYREFGGLFRSRPNGIMADAKRLAFNPSIRVSAIEFSLISLALIIDVCRFSGSYNHASAQDIGTIAPCICNALA